MARYQTKHLELPPLGGHRGVPANSMGVPWRLQRRASPTHIAISVGFLQYMYGIRSSTIKSYCSFPRGGRALAARWSTHISDRYNPWSCTHQSTSTHTQSVRRHARQCCLLAVGRIVRSLPRSDRRFTLRRRHLHLNHCTQRALPRSKPDTVAIRFSSSTPRWHRKL